MSSDSIAALFVPSAAISGVTSIHTLFTDEPETPAPPVEKAKPKRPDVFVTIEGTEVPDTDTTNRWAIKVEEVYADKLGGRINIRQVTSVGHHNNPFGGWAIETYTVTQKGEGNYTRLRYADATQIQEMYEALDGPAMRLRELMHGESEDGTVLPGPYRKNLPPVNALGKPIEDLPSRGGYGPLPAECEWIEKHDETFVEYLGTDELWPDGCWRVEKSGYDAPQFLSATQIPDVAHAILEMPVGAMGSGADEIRRRNEKMRQVLERRRAAQNGHGNVASLFAPQHPEPQPALTGIAALFT